MSTPFLPSLDNEVRFAFKDTIEILSPFVEVENFVVSKIPYIILTFSKLSLFPIIDGLFIILLLFSISDVL